MEELSLHILDLMQNCVEAKASQVEVLIAEDIANNSLVIEITDNGCGMSAEMLAAVEDPFFTTRTTRRIGLGIPLLKSAAEQAGGQFTITSALGQGTKVRAEFQHDHIDRAPLGSMADTLAAFFAVNHHVDLLYRHVVNGAEFVMDSRELRQICGDELNHPKVIQWLKTYILEHEKELGGE